MKLLQFGSENSAGKQAKRAKQGKQANLEFAPARRPTRKFEAPIIPAITNNPCGSLEFKRSRP